MNNITNPPMMTDISGMTRVDPSDVDWFGNGWKLPTTCPVGGIWTCEQSEANPPEFKKEPYDVVTNAFKPFMLYQVAGCNTRIGPVKSDVTRIVTEYLNTNWLGWLTVGMEIGVGSNACLYDLVDVSGGVSVPLNVAIATLLRNRMRDGIFDRPLIHLPAYAVTEKLPASLTDHVDIAYGPGYGIHSKVSEADSSYWIYITGPVEYAKLSAGDVYEESATERLQNRTHVIAEDMVAYRFDTCGGYKTRVDPCCS